MEFWRGFNVTFACLFPAFAYWGFVIGLGWL